MPSLWAGVGETAAAAQSMDTGVAAEARAAAGAGYKARAGPGKRKPCAKLKKCLRCLAGT